MLVPPPLAASGTEAGEQVEGDEAAVFAEGITNEWYLREETGQRPRQANSEALGGGRRGPTSARGDERRLKMFG